MAALPKRKTYFFIIGLLALTILYCLYFLYFIYGVSQVLPLRARHIVKFLFILLAYGAGGFSLKKYAAIPWTMQIWHGVYLITLLLLLLLGGYDWEIARVPFPVRVLADDLQEFLVSPVLYVVIGIMSRKFKG
jgi:hypothetical protein